jgi:hypothetical protein
MACRAGDTGTVVGANDKRAIASYAQVMEIVDRRRHS